MCAPIFFFKQKTAYEMRISDWSSDVCSSDLHGRLRRDERPDGLSHRELLRRRSCGLRRRRRGLRAFHPGNDQGKSWRMTGQESTDVIIYHNPKCGTSRNTLGLIRNAGIEPHVIEYLKTPPARALLASLIERMGVPVRSILREKETAFRELGLGDPDLTDAQLLDAMTAHPILMNRPIVVTPRGVRLCRPSEAVLDILPAPRREAFRNEDDEPVVDAAGGHAENRNGTAGR